jgi:hypothetical protein
MSRKPKPVTLAGQYPRAVIAPADVDDPFEKGAKLRVVRNLREHPIAMLHHRGIIDDAQAHAASVFRKKWESTQRGNMAIDYARTKVDGGAAVEPLPERAQEAYQWLNLLARHPGCGMVGFAILVAVCGEGRGVQETARRMKAPEKAISFRLKEALSSTLEYMDQVATGASSRTRYVRMFDEK